MNHLDETINNDLARHENDAENTCVILRCLSSNVARDPRWGRSLETFAEDPGLIAALGVAYIDGLQRGLPVNASAASSGFLKIMAVPKHLGACSVDCCNASGGANSYPRCPTCRSSFNAVVDETDLQELCCPGWEAAVRDAHAQGVMCSYNAINGVPACSNGDLLQTALVDDWGLGDGFVISDADAVAQIVPGAPQDALTRATISCRRSMRPPSLPSRTAPRSRSRMRAVQPLPDSS